VKPSNIMLEVVPSDGSVTVKLLDLGLALFGSASEAVDDFTTVGQLMGTLDYMAPEQADNSHDVDVTADVYSLGATLFKLLTGTAPFETTEYKTPLRKMKALATVAAPALRSRRAELSADIAQVVDRMLLTDASQRYSSAAEVALAVAPLCVDSELQNVAAAAMAKAAAAEELSDNLIADQISSRPPAVFVDDNRSPDQETAAALGPDAGSHEPPHRSNRRFLWAAFGVPLAMVLAAVIWLKTDTGTLKIQTVDDVQVTIREVDGDERELSLTTGTNSVQVRSGRYEILLPVEYENLYLSNGNVIVERGGSPIASILRTNNALTAFGEMFDSADVAPSQSLFDGRNFDEWRQLAQSERSPAQLEKAVEALATLGENHRDADAARVILEIAGRYPCDPNPPSPEGRLSIAVIKNLRRLNADATVPIFTEALSQPACRLHELIVGWLCFDVSQFGQDMEQPPVLLGSPNPLLAAFSASVEFRLSVAENWDKLEIATVQVPDSNKRMFADTVGNAFQILTGSWQTIEPESFVMQRLWKIVEEEIEFISTHENVFSRNNRLAKDAALILATYAPDAKIADCFPADSLGATVRYPTYVEEPHKDLWLLGNSLNWKTLSLLYANKSVSVPKEIVKIKALLSREQQRDNVVIPFQEKDGEKESIVGYHVNSRILAIDLLGLLQHDSPEVRELLAKELISLLDAAPVGDGDFALSSAWPFSLTESADNTPPSFSGFGGQGGGGFGGSGDQPLTAVVAEQTVRLNAALLAWEKITGSPARFANVARLKDYAEAPPGHIAKPPILTGPQGKPEGKPVEEPAKDPLDAKLLEEQPAKAAVNNPNDQ